MFSVMENAKYQARPTRYNSEKDLFAVFTNGDGIFDVTPLFSTRRMLKVRTTHHCDHWTKPESFAPFSAVLR